MRLALLFVALVIVTPPARADDDAVSGESTEAASAEPAISGTELVTDSGAPDPAAAHPTTTAPALVSESASTTAPLVPSAHKRKILILTPTANEELTSTAEVVANLVAVKTASYPTLDVMTTTDVVRLMSLEADRQLLGCDDTSCAAEIADAMGANLVVFGDVSKLGSVLIVNLSLFDSDKAEPLGRVVAQSRDEATLPGELDAKIEGLLANLPDVGAASVTLTNAPVDDGLAVLPWTLAGGGALVFVAGIVLGVVIASVPYLLAKSALDAGTSALEAPQRSAGETRQAESAYGAAHENYRFAQSLEMPLLATSSAFFAVAVVGLATSVAGAWWALSSGEGE